MSERQQDLKVIKLIAIVSAAAIAFLFWLIYFAPSATTQVSWSSKLPALNAILNTLSASCLLMGVIAVKKKNLELHKKLLFSAFGFSSLFLVSYIIYHYFQGDTKFLAQGMIRPVYFFILISHILLSIIALPMVLTTFYLGIKDSKEKHRKWAKWTFPIWLYVSITGVLIFIILKLFQPAVTAVA